MAILKNSITAGNVSLAPAAIIAQRNPLSTDNFYEKGQVWINSATNAVFTLTSISNNAANWEGNGSSGGGTITGDNLTINPGPTAITGEFRVEANVDEADVIRLRENGGVSGSISIISSTGTSSDSILLQSSAGGIEVTTNGAGGDIAITSDLGRVTVGSGENIAGAVEVEAGGGALSTILLTNTAGTAANSIELSSDLGGIEIATAAASKDILISSALGSIGIVGGEDVLDAVVIQADGGTASGLLIENTSGTGTGAVNTSAIGILATDGSVYVESQAALPGAMVLDASDAAGGMLLNAGTAGIDIATTGALSLDAQAASNFTVTGAFDLTLDSSAGKVIIDGGDNAVDAVTINTSDAAGGIDINAGTGGITIDTTGAMSLDSAASSNVTVTGAAADLTLSSSGGSVNMLASEAAANAIRIQASDAAGGIDIDAGTAGFIVDTTGGISLDSATASNMTVTGVADLTLRSTGGAVVISSSEVAADAIQLTATDVAGGVTSNRSITISTAGAGIILPGPVRIVSGAGSPDTAVTAPQGSMYLRTDGTGVNDRAYINTDGATAWTALVTVA